MMPDTRTDCCLTCLWWSGDKQAKTGECTAHPGWKVRNTLTGRTRKAYPETWATGRCDEYTPKVFGMRRWHRKTIGEKILASARPEEVLQGLKTKLRESLSKEGTFHEQRSFERILEEFDALLPPTISKRKVLRYANLLDDAIALWLTGKEATQKEESVRLHERLKVTNPKKNPRYEDLFRYANTLYDVWNENARNLQTWLRKNRKADIVFKNKKVTVRKGLSDKSLESMVEEAQSIGSRQALRDANKLLEIFSPEEFDAKEENLQDAYTKYRRPGHRRKKGHGVH